MGKARAVGVSITRRIKMSKLLYSFVISVVLSLPVFSLFFVDNGYVLFVSALWGWLGWFCIIATQMQEDDS